MQRRRHRCTCCAVRQYPAVGLARLAGTQRRYSVAGDGAVVVQLQVKLAVGHRQHGVNDSQRVAGAGKGTHGEVARGVVDKRQLAIVCHAIVRTYPNTRRVGNRRRSVFRGIPAVVKACRHREAVVRHIAAPLCLHQLRSTTQREVRIAEMRPFTTVVGGEAHKNGLPVIRHQVDSVGGPVFPQHFVGRLRPPEVGIGNEIGHTARIYQCAFLIQYFKPEAGL